MAVAGRYYRNVNPVVNYGLPEQAGCDDERLAALSRPSKRDKLVLVLEKLFLVFCWCKVEYVFAKLDGVDRNPFMFVAHHQLLQSFQVAPDVVCSFDWGRFLEAPASSVLRDPNGDYRTRGLT